MLSAIFLPPSPSLERRTEGTNTKRRAGEVAWVLRVALGALLSVLAAACGSGGAPSTNTPIGSHGDALYDDWQEDHDASTRDRAVFVPNSVDLPMARFRQTLHFGRDGSFSMLRLSEVDAHYDCPGTFVLVASDTIEAKCRDPETRESLKIGIHLIEVLPGKLTVKIGP